MTHGSDTCFCGDYRSQHNRGASKTCAVCGCSGFKDGRPATKEERAHWEQYHGSHAIWRRAERKSK